MTGRLPMASQAVITPEMLASTIQVNGQSGVFLIKGVARKVRAWPSTGPVKWIYGFLDLNDTSVKFRADPSNGPSEGERVVLSATLDIKAARAADRHTWTGAYEVQLLAEKVGTWAQGESERPTLQLAPRPDRLPLEGFLELHDVVTLTVLASAKAETDLLQALTEAGIARRPKVVRARFDDEATIIAAIRQAAADGAHGVALARGGGVGLELIADSPRIVAALTALEAPFYSAQGHGDDIFLVDKYADECFATPSVLGLAIARAETKVAGRRRDRGELADLRRRSGNLEAELERTKISEQRAAERVMVLQGQRAKRIHVDRQGVTLSWRTLLIVSGVLAFAFALLWILA